MAHWGRSRGSGEAERHHQEIPHTTSISVHHAWGAGVHFASGVKIQSVQGLPHDTQSSRSLTKSSHPTCLAAISGRRGVRRVENMT